MLDSIWILCRWQKCKLINSTWGIIRLLQCLPQLLHPELMHLYRYWSWHYPTPASLADWRGSEGWRDSISFFWSLQYFSKLQGSVCVTSLSAQSMLTQPAKDCEIKWWSHLRRLRRGAIRCMKCLFQSVRTWSRSRRSHPPGFSLSLTLLCSFFFFWTINALTNTWQIYSSALCEPGRRCCCLICLAFAFAVLADRPIFWPSEAAGLLRFSSLNPGWDARLQRACSQDKQEVWMNSGCFVVSG